MYLKNIVFAWVCIKITQTSLNRVKSVPCSIVGRPRVEVVVILEIFGGILQWNHICGFEGSLKIMNSVSLIVFI